MAAKRIVESARAECPDCTTEDVVEAVRRKAAHLLQQDGIKSPVGVLITYCADLVVIAHNERLAIEAKHAVEAARSERVLQDTDFLASLDGLPSDNPWLQILDSIKGHILPHSYETWLRPLRFVCVCNRVLQVCVPSAEFKVVAEKYADHFDQAIRDLGLDLTSVECLTSD